MQEPEIGADCVTLAYWGLDHRRRATTLRWDPAPERLTAEHADFLLDIEPKKASTLVMEIGSDAGAPPQSPASLHLRRRCARARRGTAAFLFTGGRDHHLR